jgi:hypothetical protein
VEYRNLSIATLWQPQGCVNFFCVAVLGGRLSDVEQGPPDDLRSGVRWHAYVDLGVVAELPGRRAEGQPSFKP